jgi:hypothetical protein
MPVQKRYKVMEGRRFRESTARPKTGNDPPKWAGIPPELRDVEHKRRGVKAEMRDGREARIEADRWGAEIGDPSGNRNTGTDADDDVVEAARLDVRDQPLDRRKRGIGHAV